MLDSIADCYNSEALEFECRNGQKRAAPSTCCYRPMCLGSLTAYFPVHCLQTEMILQIFRQMINFKEEALLFKKSISTRIFMKVCHKVFTFIYENMQCVMRDCIKVKVKVFGL